MLSSDKAAPCMASVDRLLALAFHDFLLMARHNYKTYNTRLDQVDQWWSDDSWGGLQMVALRILAFVCIITAHKGARESSGRSMME